MILRSEGEPHDRMTRLCDVMAKALDADPEKGDTKSVIFLSSSDGRRGLVTNGYEDDRDAIVDVLGHLRALFKANGVDFEILPVTRPIGQG